MIDTTTGSPPVEDPVLTPPPPGTLAPLVRSRDDRVVAGVAAGLAAHVGIDPAIVRVGFIILAFAGGWGLVAYGVAWIVIPDAPSHEEVGPPRSVAGNSGVSVLLGAILVLLGAAWLLDQVLPGIGHLTWPAALMLLGVGVILAGGRR